MSHSQEKQVILETNALIMNPSIVSINPLGSLYLTMSYNGALMGYITSSEEVSVVPGKNYVKLTGYVKPENMTLAEELISR